MKSGGLQLRRVLGVVLSGLVRVREKGRGLSGSGVKSCVVGGAGVAGGRAEARVERVVKTLQTAGVFAGLGRFLNKGAPYSHRGESIVPEGLERERLRLRRGGLALIHGRLGPSRGVALRERKHLDRRGGCVKRSELVHSN